jgi:hypothetical protein
MTFLIYNIFTKKKSEASTIIYAISSDLICMGEAIRDLRKIIEFNKSEKVKQEEHPRTLILIYDLYLCYLESIEEKRKKRVEHLY